MIVSKIVNYLEIVRFMIVCSKFWKWNEASIIIVIIIIIRGG